MCAVSTHGRGGLVFGAGISTLMRAVPSPRTRMTLLGNIIWLIFGGLLSGLAYMVAGVLLCLTIVGAPFGVQVFKIGVATLAPFGKQVVELPRANSPLRIVFNVLWLVLAGWEIAVAHLVWAGVLALTIVGIPFAIQHLKLIPLALLPFGRDLR